ncbi:MAG: amidohydrolase [Gammaproteobacteria bacterium]|nr:amidohydrolase [Gammaproteobacteria bacterium]
MSIGPALLGLIACSPPTDHVAETAADRVFLNGQVYTVDENRSWAEAIAIKEGKIVYVGDNAGASRRIGDTTQVTDLRRQMMLPGFHDSHIHIMIGVMADQECSLLRLETPEDVAERLKECTSLAGLGGDGWILGGGWGEWLWPDANPQKGLLDLLFPDRPVYLESSFGHAAWVNSKAMETVGLDAGTESPPAGVIERDAETGEPSGTLRDAAMLLVKNKLPPMTLQQRTDRVRAGMALAHSVGITAVIEPGLDGELIRPIVALADAGELDMRVRASLSPINWQPGVFDESVFEFLDEREQWRRENLDVDSVKIYMDGVIEYGTSPLLEPYADEHYGSGDFFYTQDEVDRYMRRFDAMGLQVHVHAIGDAAIRRALDGFGAMREANGMSDNRHQIVHLQLIHEDDRPRFGELDIAAVFQPLWAYPDPAALELDVPMLGRERTWQMYPIASVQKAGGRIVGGSDYFVTDLNPLHAIEVAVTRQDPYTNDGPVLNEDERVDLRTMIDAYTINGAYQMGLEHEQGSIEVGKRADLIVLDRNLFELSASEINEAKVTMTVFDGRTVYE